MGLEKYARPLNDTGFGIHWATSATRWGLDNWSRWDAFLDQVPSISWGKMIDNPGGAQEENYGQRTISLAKRLVDRGIMPVLRIYRAEPNSPNGGGGILNSGDLEQIQRYLDVGVVYFEWNNEPDSQREWSGPMPPNWLEIVTSDFINDANRLLNMSDEIVPLYPAFSFGGGRQNPFVMIRDSGNAHLFDRMGLAVHNYSLGRPANYPNDPISLYGDRPENHLTYEQWVAANPQDPMWAWEMSHDRVNEYRTRQAIDNWRVINEQLGGDPDRLIEYDYTCYRAYERFDMWVREAAGHSIPLLCTEGGVNIGERAPGDARYPRPTPLIAADLNMEIFHSTPPDYWFFRNCYWCIACYHMGVIAVDYEAQGPLFTDWYNTVFGLNGEIPFTQRLRDERSKIHASGPLPSAWPLYKGPSLEGRNFSNELKYHEPQTLLVPVEDTSQWHYRLQEVNHSFHGKGRVFVRVQNEDGQFLEGIKIEVLDPAGNKSTAETKGAADNWYGNLPVNSFPEEGVTVYVNDGLPSDRLDGIYAGELHLTFIRYIRSTEMAYDFSVFEREAFENFIAGGTPPLPQPPSASLANGVPPNYGISIAKVGGQPGDLVTYCLGVKKVPCRDNAGMHHIWLQILNDQGEPIAHSGQFPGKPAILGKDTGGTDHFLVLDKPPNERKDLVQWAGRKYSVQGHAVGTGNEHRVVSSAVVEGLASTWRDEEPGCTWGHFSWHVVFMASILEEEIEPPVNPVARIEGPVSAKVGDLVAFTGLPSEGQITTYEWIMGDGTNLTGANVQHTYQAKGTYTVRLTVTDVNNLQGTTEHQITITEDVVIPPPTGTTRYAVTGAFEVSQDQSEIKIDLTGKK